MADYKDIKGGTIQNFAGDPPAPIVGQVWYDSTAVAFQYRTSNPAGAWSTAANLNTARQQAGASGNSTAALVFGGTADPPKHALTESYDGSSWTEVGDLNTARTHVAGCGTQTAALAFAGDGSPSQLALTETWDGSSWTEVGDLNTARRQLWGAGTNTSALAFGGETAPGAGSGQESSVLSETWNGSAWTEGGDLNAARRELGGGGVVTSALAFGGQGYPHPTSHFASNESYNGSTWTEVADLNTGRDRLAGSGASNTAALAFGGEASPGNVTNTEQWNGTVWTEVNDLNTAAHFLGGHGTTSSTIAQLGGAPSTSNKAEEWNTPSETSETITTS